MKICPVCNDSFPDELNFCDIDGTRLNRGAGEASGDDRRKWWSLLGAGLLVGAVVISAASIIFLPKARVSTPMVSSEPPLVTAPAKGPSVESPTTVAAATASAAPASEPDTSAADAVAPEPRRKDKSNANSNTGGEAPNPKAAALAAEGVDTTAHDNKNAASPGKSEAPIATKPVSDTRPAETVAKPAQTSPDVKKDQKTTAVAAKVPDKSSDKKKNDDKDKKKGGFLRVFKKIFGKD